MSLNNVSDHENLANISNGTAGEMVFYVESTGNKTYEEDSTIEFQTATAWVASKKPKNFDVLNTSTTDVMTVEFNDNGVLFTIAPEKGKGAISIPPYISKVNIVATDTFELLLRK